MNAESEEGDVSSNVRRSWTEVGWFVLGAREGGRDVDDGVAVGGRLGNGDRVSRAAVANEMRKKRRKSQKVSFQLE